jgi:hypothetical protein
LCKPTESQRESFGDFRTIPLIPSPVRWRSWHTQTLVSSSRMPSTKSWHMTTLPAS